MTIPGAPDDRAHDAHGVSATDTDAPEDVDLDGLIDMLIANPEIEIPPSTRPAQWTDRATGAPIYAHQPDLFAAPADPGIRSCGWNEVQALTFLGHLDRNALQACWDRDFTKAWLTNPATGERTPRMFPVATEALDKCQYAVLTHPQRSAVLVIDIDRPSNQPGGQVTNLHPDTYTALDKLAVAGLGPAWLGINPGNGKAQAIWLIDPVYAGEGRTSPNTRLLAIATSELNKTLGGDLAFSHRFSRWPLHRSSDPTAYRWHCQHNQIVRLSDLVTKVRRMNNTDAPETPARRQFASGRERIQAAQEARRAAQALRALDTQLPAAEDLEPAAHGIIDGVRVIWASRGRTARDETAFRHALKTAHKMRAAGEPLKDAKIIDAYERGYNVAQAVGADHRLPDMPPMRDRLTMARRVRGYVIAGNTNPTSTAASTTRMDSAGRKALATLGSRGGKKAAERWNDPDSDYARNERAKLAAANQKRAWKGAALRAQVQSTILSARVETGQDPSTKELARDLGASEKRIRELRQELGLQARRGRPRKMAKP